MRSDALCTLSSLWMVTTRSEATSAAVRSLPDSCFMESSVSNSLTTMS